MADRRQRLSRRLAYVLRHDPGSVGVRLGEGGWVELDRLVSALNAHGEAMTVADIGDLMATATKQRFEVDGNRIRVAQGHSLPVDLGLAPSTPPERLYHGTVERFLAGIRRDGLVPGERSQVHLSPDRATAMVVGHRRGAPIVLTVRAGQMADDGFAFFLAANGVWLTAHVPPAYIEESGSERRDGGDDLLG